MAERKFGAPRPATTVTVAGEDWSGRDISGQTHERVAFVDLDLTEVENTGAVFTECTFRGARFNVSTHVDAAFVNCTFVNCDFFGARFTGCKLLGSMFDRCTYETMQVSGGEWSFVGMPGADLRSASFAGVRMREADLTGARCEGASIRDVDLPDAWPYRARFSGCDLRGAIVTYEQALVIAVALGLDVRAE